jgi:putative ABC transport system permease protein
MNLRTAVVSLPAILCRERALAHWHGSGPLTLINKIVIENLKHRWVRTLLSALIIGVQVTSILTLLGLSRGMLEDQANRTRALGADIFLRPGSASALSFSSAPISEKFLALVAKQPHVKQAVGVLSVSTAILLTPLSGLDLAEFTRFNGGFKFLKGGPFQGPDDLIVDEYYARQNKVHVGDAVKLINHQWHVCGIVESGRLGRLVAPLATLQKLTSNTDPPKITQILVKLDDPSLTPQVVSQLNEAMQGNLQAISMEAFVSQYSINNIVVLRSFIIVVNVLAIFVGFLVVFLSMYTAVIERTREIGIMKALGARPRTILNLLIRETVLLAAAGSVLGIVMSFGVQALIMALVPASLQVAQVPDWWGYASLIAVTGALLGAVYPGLKAARQDAIEALAYE